MLLIVCRTIFAPSTRKLFQPAFVGGFRRGSECGAKGRLLRGVSTELFVTGSQSDKAYWLQHSQFSHEFFCIRNLSGFLF